tara:strand:+ start:495 stop:767 length:273 start_codon:yes stop_codon:yes gene_type:complete
MISEAIIKINADAKFVIRGMDVNTCEIEWMEGTSEISKDAIKAKIAETEYQRKRLAEYPSMADQLDDIYNNGIDEWKKTIKVVKDKYPKE